MLGAISMLTDTQLNDIISLAIGLWAVKAAQKSSSDKYSFGVCLRVVSQVWSMLTIPQVAKGRDSWCIFQCRFPDCSVFLYYPRSYHAPHRASRDQQSEIHPRCWLSRSCFESCWFFGPWRSCAFAQWKRQRSYSR